jgi:hypothetical protein
LGQLPLQRTPIRRQLTITDAATLMSNNRHVAGCPLPRASSLCPARPRDDTTRQGGLRYRYYTCVQAQKNGWQSCPSKSIPAAPIEELVLGQIHQLGHDPQLLNTVLAQVRHEDDARLAELEAERGGLERDLLRGQGELRKLLAGWSCAWPCS